MENLPNKKIKVSKLNSLDGLELIPVKLEHILISPDNHTFALIAAETTDEARSLVYNDTLNCIQTLKAELVFSGPMRMGDHHYYDLNGDMANEFNESFHSDML